jgi:Flp pilus assembly protein TadD
VAEFPKETQYLERVAVSHFNLGQVTQQSGQLNEAEQHYGQTLQVYERNPALVANRSIQIQSSSGLATVLAKSGRPEEAEQIYRKLLKSIPNDAETCNNLA